MKRFTLFIVAVLLLQQYSFAWEKNQKMFGLIFADVVNNLDKKTPQTNGFEINRAYLGYQNEFAEGFTAKITLDIGAPDDASDFALKRRFAYFKNAGIQYKKGDFTGAFGIIGMYAYKVQEKFWGRRYMMHSFMDRNRFGPSADIGAFAQYRFNDWFSGEVTISNGEGNNNLQVDNEYKFAVGSQFDFCNGCIARLYYDIIPREFAPQATYSSFLGYKHDKFSIAGEFNYQENYRLNEVGGDKYGYSVYGTYWLTEKIDCFVRYDQLYSSLDETGQPYDLSRDGSELKTGVEYLIIKQIRASLNYHDMVPYAQNVDAQKYVFLNVEIKF